MPPRQARIVAHTLIILAGMVLPHSLQAQPHQTLQLSELWRIGHEGDANIFGVIFDVVADSDGNTYVFDRQLVEVHKFSPEGGFLGVIAREGEGPGELRYPCGLFITRDGDLGLVERVPGSVKVVTTEGDPVGHLPMPEPELGSRIFASGARQTRDRLILYLNQVGGQGNDDFERWDSLVSIDGTGAITATFCENSHIRPSGDAHYFENSLVGFEKWIWCVDARDRVIVNRVWDDYELEVYSLDGELLRLLGRDKGQRVRTKTFYEKKKRYHAEAIVGSHHDGKQITFEVSKTDRTIQGIYPRLDGSLWVLTSRGAFDNAEGVLATFDVFDGDGEFSRTVSVRAPGNLRDDKIYISQGRLFLVANHMAAMATALGGNWSEDDGEPQPMSVICYCLPDVLE